MFQRKPLRDDVQKEILNRLVDGRLPAGSRINETHLATDLGLSRTPLREAMITLVAQGFLASDMGRGFAVPALDATRFREYQTLLENLEPLALSGIRNLPPQTIMELDNLVKRTRLGLERQDSGIGSAQNLTMLVFRFSELTLANSDNETLKATILRLQGLSSPYWYQMGFKGMPWREIPASYSQLYDLLRNGQIETAAQHWARQTHLTTTSAAQFLLGTGKAKSIG